MTTLKRLLLATTILSAAGAWAATAAPQEGARIILAQQAAPDADKKPEGRPGKPAPAQPRRPDAPTRPTPPAAQQPSPRQPSAPQPAQRREAPQRPSAQQAEPPRRPGAPAAQTPQQRREQPPAAQTPQPRREQGPAAQTPQQRRDEAPAAQSPERRREQTPAAQTPERPRDQSPAAQPPEQRREQAPAAQTPDRRRDQSPAAQTPEQRREQPPAAQTPQPRREQQPPAAQTPEQRREQQPPAAQTPEQRREQMQRPAQPGQPQQPDTQRPAIRSAPQTQPSAAQPRRIEDVRQQRREERRGNQTIIVEGDRTIIREGDRTFIRRDESQRFRFNARDVRVDRRGDEVRTVAIRPDGSQIITITDDDGRLLRRLRRDPRGREVVIIDNSFRPGPRYGAGFAGFVVALPPPVIRIPRERYIVEADHADEELIYETLIAPPVEHIERRYTLDEIRYSPQLRDRMPRIDIDTVNFDSGSWEVTPDQVDRLAPVADAIRRAIDRNPNEVYLIEGHTDAVGADEDNLSLSDRRAESVAQVLSEQFQIPPENLTTQGYGEQQLKIPTEGPERQNRRVTVRRITPLLTGEAQQSGAPVPR